MRVMVGVAEGGNVTLRVDDTGVFVWGLGVAVSMRGAEVFAAGMISEDVGTMSNVRVGAGAEALVDSKEVESLEA